MYGIITSTTYSKDIVDSIPETELIFHQVGNFTDEDFLQQCQAAARINLSYLIVDYTCCENPETILSGLRKFRFSRDSRIILFAPGVQPGDPVIYEIVNLGVWDIVAPELSSEFDDDAAEFDVDVTAMLRDQMDKPMSYSNVIRWHMVSESVQTKRFAQTQSNQSEAREKIVIQEKIRMLRSRTVVIGSLYPGAGSSFVRDSLSRILSHLGLQNAAVEHPVIVPEMYAQLFGDRFAPKHNEFGYRFIQDDVIEVGRPSRGENEWRDGLSTWFPANPKGVGDRNWTYEHMYKLMLGIRDPVILLDVSHNWMDPTVQETCMDADLILFVADNIPSKFQREDMQINTEFLRKLIKMGKEVQVIGNKDIPTRHRKQREEWIRSLPIKPICMHPYIDYQSIMESRWEDEFVQDIPEVRDIILRDMYPVFAKIVPPGFPLKPLLPKIDRFKWLKELVSSLRVRIKELKFR